MDKKKLRSILSICALVLGVLTFLMMFMEVGGAKGMDGGFKGSEIVFGYKEKVAGLTAELLKFNFVALLAFVLPLAGGIVGFIAGRKENKMLTWIAAALFLVGFILIILLPVYWDMAAANKMIAEKLKMLDIKVLFGGILAGVFALLGAGACVARNIIKE